MIEAHSIPLADSSSTIREREAKNLLLFPFQPIQSHSYGPQSRFGFGSRQTNSPINPAIGEFNKIPSIAVIWIISAFSNYFVNNFAGY
jgi:hypothetical protein